MESQTDRRLRAGSQRHAGRQCRATGQCGAAALGDGLFAGAALKKPHELSGAPLPRRSRRRRVVDRQPGRRFRQRAAARSIHARHPRRHRAASARRRFHRFAPERRGDAARPHAGSRPLLARHQRRLPRSLPGLLVRRIRRHAAGAISPPRLRDDRSAREGAAGHAAVRLSADARRGMAAVVSRDRFRP